MNRLKNFPISFFAPVLGFSGFALLMTRLQHLFPIPEITFYTLTAVSILLFVLVSVLYLFKTFSYFAEVKKEFVHPVRMNFFPVIAKVLLILSIIFLEISMPLSKWLWIIGVIINVFFSFQILGEWIRREHFQIQHINPSWFLPVVGNMIIPIAGVQHAPIEISWFFFSIGLIWMFILSTIIFYRIFFYPPIPQKLLPTLFILFAAPAIAFIAYSKLSGDFDAFARILYYFSAFIVLLLASQWKMFFKIQFYLSWWAYSFPLAAFGLATILMYSLTQFAFFSILSAFVAILLSLLIVLLSFQTIKAIRQKNICKEED